MSKVAGKNYERKFPRVPVYRHARVETDMPKESVSATVFEIGAGGCGLRLEKALDVGQQVRISLYDQKRMDPLILKAQVKWSSNVEGSKVYSCGLQFLAVIDGATERSMSEVEN